MKHVIIILLFSSFLHMGAIAQDAKGLVKAAFDLARGESSYAEMSMTIVRPTYQRTVKFKSWVRGTDMSLTLITDPAKDKGQTFLKRENEMWNWNPTISKLIKMPSSMLSQGWMGSDYTNDDILKETSILDDYTHKLLGSETFDGSDCHKIELTPLPNAAVVWGKIVMWITKDTHFIVKSLYYDEDNELSKTELATDIKLLGNRKIPSRMEIIPADNPNQKTVVVIDKMEFNIKIEDKVFTQQYMKSIR